MTDDIATLKRRSFTVRVNEIRAALLFASTDDTRFILNGVLFEVEPSKHRQPILVATDGRRLAVIETAAAQADEPTEAFQVTLSAAFLKPLCAFAKSQSAEVTFDYHPSERVIASFVGGHCFVDCEKGAVIDGVYPKWRDVIPTGDKEPVPSIGMNAEMLADYAKAAKIFQCENPVIRMNLFSQSSAMEIRMDAWPTFYGVLMPCRPSEQDQWQPEFLMSEPKARPAMATA